jgi:hypothetical protein
MQCGSSADKLGADDRAATKAFPTPAAESSVIRTMTRDLDHKLADVAVCLDMDLRGGNLVQRKAA